MRNGLTAIRVALLTNRTAVAIAFEAYSAMETDMEYVSAFDGHGDELDSILAAQPDLIVLAADLSEGIMFDLVDKIRNRCCVREMVPINTVTISVAPITLNYPACRNHPADI